MKFTTPTRSYGKQCDSSRKASRLVWIESGEGYVVGGEKRAPAGRESPRGSPFTTRTNAVAVLKE